MLFLPAAALCCLCSALLTMAAQLIQKDKILTRRVGEKVSFSCGGTRQCGGSVYWYQLKEKETFKYLQTISMYTIENIRPDHSATYYCVCWKYASGYAANNHLIFGSGTKLSVTDGNQSGQKRTTQAPRVHANTWQSPTRPAGPRIHVDGNSSLLCVPPAMFPSLVQLSCKRQKKNGGLEELPPAEGEQLQLIHEQENSTYKCSCYIKDGGRTVEARTREELPAPAASCPPEREPADLPALQPADWSFQSQCRVKLLCLLYTVLIVKSLVYCCGLSLLMILRNKGASTNCTHAD